MLVTYIRSSSYNNYDYCQQQYYISYVLGHPTSSGKKAEMGTIVHKVMECLGAGKKHVQDHPRKKLIINDEAIGDISVPKKDLYKDSFVNDIFLRSYEHYVSNSPHKFTKGDKKNCKDWVWLALNFNEGQFDPRKRLIVASEPHFDIEIKEPWAKYEYTLPNGEVVSGNLAIKGTIDLITEVSEGVLEAIDWKTGKRIDWASGEEKDLKKLAKDPQLLLYNFAISEMFSDYKQSIMTIFYIKDGGPFSLCFDDLDKQMFLGMLKDRFEEIKNNNSPKMLSENQAHWKCKKLCDFYKNNWEGTDTNICRHVSECLKKEGIEGTTSKCTKQGFNIGHYDAPG